MSCSISRIAMSGGNASIASSRMPTSLAAMPAAGSSSSRSRGPDGAGDRARRGGAKGVPPAGGVATTAEPQPLQDRLGAGQQVAPLSRRPPQIDARAGMLAGRNVDVLEHAQPGKQAGDLKGP